MVANLGMDGDRRKRTGRSFGPQPSPGRGASSRTERGEEETERKSTQRTARCASGVTWVRSSGSGRCCRSGGLNGVVAAVEADVVDVAMGIAVVLVDSEKNGL